MIDLSRRARGNLWSNYLVPSLTVVGESGGLGTWAGAGGGGVGT